MTKIYYDDGYLCYIYVGPTDVKKKDLIRNCVPPNIVKATTQQDRILKSIA